MPGIGTLVNAIAVIAAGVGGLVIGRFLNERIQNTMMVACGVSVMFIGIAGAMEKMLVIQDGQFSATGTMLVVGSLCLGGLIGEWIDLDARTEQLGAWLKVKSHSEKDPMFIEGFVTTALTICIGAMAILGPINDALYHDYTILFAKSILDFVIVIALASSLGKGCTFAVIPLVVIEGGITLVAKLVSPFVRQDSLHDLALVGSIIIFCVGINLVFGKKVKVANLLPALVIAALWCYLPFA